MTVVNYHGKRDRYHGTYLKVGPCPCSRCDRRDGSRLELLAWDIVTGHPTGVRLGHVGTASVSPL